MNPLATLTTRLILASQSPRRRALLEQINATFTVQVSPAEENVEKDLSAPKTARLLAERKAAPVAETNPHALVLAADTVVIHENDILGKPKTHTEARRMLHRLSDDSHAVYTGIALYHKSSRRRISAGRKTIVHFANLTTREITSYVETEAPMDKAGGYGIQDHTGPLFVKHLEGDYYNVVGLPLRRLYEVLRQEYSDLIE